MKQETNITNSKDITIIQAGGDVHYTQPEKTKELLPDEREELTRKYLEFITNRYKTIHCMDAEVHLTTENYIPLKLGEVKKEERLKGKREEELKETKDIDFRIWREEHSPGEGHSLTPGNFGDTILNYSAQNKIKYCVLEILPKFL